MELTRAVEDALNQAVGIDIVRLGRKIEHQAMVEGRPGHPVHVVVADVGPAVEQGHDFGPQHQGLAAARA